jgi:hypothetical protein
MKHLSILLLIFCISLYGCATKDNIITRTEYVEVYKPVVVEIKLPDKPKFKSSESTPTYLAKVLNYTRHLEFIINEHNRSYSNIGK